MLCFAPALLAQTLPPGTALPVMVSSTLNAKSSKPGQKIEGRLMQEVLLPSGAKIKSGAHVSGHVINVTKPSGSGSAIVVKFDTLDDGESIPLNLSLRALAASESVFQAKTPVDATSTEESSNQWVTKQVGGEYVFRGRGYVASDQGKVGIWSGSGVFGKLTAGGDCPGADGNGEQQALWIFSTSACGVYGFEHLKLAHAGRTAPLGEIKLESEQNVLVRGGSGWLLVVNAASSETSPSH